MNESEFQRQITDLAELYGWSWVHFRPARTAHGWATPVSGPLGKGWPDLILVKGLRAIAAELKSNRGKLADEQWAVLETLRMAGLETHVWFPDDFDEIVRSLSR